jgi:hypothetical protein
MPDKLVEESQQEGKEHQEKEPAPEAIGTTAFPERLIGKSHQYPK